MSNELLGFPPHQFAVLAIETTGFSPNHGDAIVEIAIQTVNWNGEIVDFFESLVNPKKEVTGELIHGITSQMVKIAPSLEELLPNIQEQLNGKTIVAHNLHLLNKFFPKEVTNLLKEEKSTGICTLNLSNKVDPELPFHRLKQLCDYYDIDMPRSHTAKTDCIATAKLFSILKNAFINQGNQENFVSEFVRPLLIESSTSNSVKTIVRAEAQEKIRIEKERFYELINRLSSTPCKSLPVQQYLNVLDRALADRVLTEKEAYSLFELASDYSISREQTMEIHEEYLRKLTRIYLLDEILSKSERKDLRMVAELLCVEESHLNNLIEFEQASISVTCPQQSSNMKSLIGKSVCFMGHMHARINGKKIEKGKAQELANERGLIVKSVVSKKLDFLVTTDPEKYNAKGRKAQKANEYNVKIIAEDIFWEMIGVKVDIE